MEVPKRILYVITKGTWGGAQRYVYDLAAAAKARGHQVVVAYGSEGVLAQHLREQGLRSVRLPSLERDISLTSDWSAYRELYRLISQEAPDVLHLNSSKVGLLGALAGRVLNIPCIIFTAHGWAFNEDRSPATRAALWLAHYTTLLLCHKTIAVSRAVLGQTKSMPLVRGKVQMIPLGIEEPDFMEREFARAQLEARMQTPLLGGTLWIGALSELTWNKSVHTLLRALKILKERGVPAGVVVFGEGEERQFLETLVGEQGLQEQVRLLGFVQEGARYLKAFDIFAFPSRTEALGYALIEAGYAGLPCVASCVGGVPEIVEQGVSGMLVQRENAAALADALELLIKNPQRRGQLGSALQQSVRRKFSLERMLKETLALY